MSLIQQVFGSSPFQPLVEHAGKVQECVELRPLLAEALVTAHSENLTFSSSTAADIMTLRLF